MASDRFPDATYELGELREDFRVSQTDLLVNLLCIPLGLGLLGLFVLYRMPQLLVPRNLLEWMIGLAGILAIGGIIVWGVFVIAGMYANRHLRVLLFADGLVYFRRDGVDVCRWDEIAWTTDDYAQLGKMVIRRFIVQSGVETLVFGETIAPIKDFPRMVETIEARVAEHLLPQAFSDLRAGKSVDCGAVQVTVDGIMHDERLLPWSEFEWIGSQKFNVAIEQSGAWVTWATIPSGEIRNKTLLIELATQLSKPGEYSVTA